MGCGRGIAGEGMRTREYGWVNADMRSRTGECGRGNLEVQGTCTWGGSDKTETCVKSNKHFCHSVCHITSGNPVIIAKMLAVSNIKQHLYLQFPTLNAIKYVLFGILLYNYME